MNAILKTIALCKECLVDTKVRRVVQLLDFYQSQPCEKCKKNVAESIVEIFDKGI